MDQALTTVVNDSMKHATNRRTNPRPPSTWPRSSPPAFEVMSPPSKPATTARRSTASNSNRVGAHSVGIGALPGAERNRCCTTLFSDSQPRCSLPFEESRLARRQLSRLSPASHAVTSDKGVQVARHAGRSLRIYARQRQAEQLRETSASWKWLPVAREPFYRWAPDQASGRPAVRSGG